MRKNILTFDVEDWFHILDFPDTRSVDTWSNFESRITETLPNLLKLLKRRNTKATFLILGWIAEKYPRLIKEIVDDGHEIGSHSYSHPLIYELSPEEFRADTIKANQAIKSAVGIQAKIYRAPGFSITRETTWAFDILMDLDFEVDLSVFPAKRAHGGMAGYFANHPHVLMETKNKKLIGLPMNYGELIGLKFMYGGGGYFRLLPYAATRFMFCRTNYNMTYFHPRDFDYSQPRLKNLSSLRTFKSYVGLKTSMKKLDQLLCDFEFQTVGNFMESYIENG